MINTLVALQRSLLAFCHRCLIVSLLKYVSLSVTGGIIRYSLSSARGWGKASAVTFPGVHGGTSGIENCFSVEFISSRVIPICGTVKLEIRKCLSGSSPHKASPERDATSAK